MQNKEVFTCPKNPNHIAHTLAAHRKHINKCKELNDYPGFYICKYNEGHAFISPHDRDNHEEM